MMNTITLTQTRQSVARGFTLIEMMITVAIVGILAAIAYPSYVAHVAKGNRAEGRAAALKMLMDQERWFTQNNTYVAITTVAGQPLKNFSGEARARSRYLLRAQACPGVALNECVQVIAEPQFGGGDPEVGNLTILSTGGIKGCTGTTTNLCWPS